MTNFTSAGKYWVILTFIFFAISASSQTFYHPVTGLQTTFAGDCMVNGCGGTYYDDGGPNGNYSYNIGVAPGYGIYRTFCPDAPGQCIQLDFTYFDIEPQFGGVCYDFMQINNGPTQNGQNIWQGCGTTSPGVVTSTDESGCITVRFYSDNILNAGGWAANISCVPCSGNGPSTGLNTDCINAQYVCDNLQSVVANSQGPGLIADACNSGCVLSENYSNWYTLNVTQAGVLGLTISPTPLTADYDFALYGPVTGGCSNLGPPIRCSYAENTGNTGMSNTAFDLSEDVTGDGWVRTANVIVGTYYLMVNQWSYQSNSKFRLDFNGTATLGLPTPAIYSNAPVCENESLQLNGFTSPGATYNWSGPGGWSATTVDAVRSPAVAGTYSFYYTVNGCNSPTATLNVTVESAPTPVINPAATSVCNGSSVTLDASGGNSYVWSNSATTSSITVNPVATTIYTVTATGSNACTATTSSTVSVGTVATASISPAAPAICEGENITLTASSGVSYMWDNSEITQSITVSPTVTTAYTVTVTDAGSCTATASVSVNVNPLPSATVTPMITDICEGDNATLQAGVGVSYLWDNNATTSSITVNPTITTSYMVTVTDASGCKSTASGTVNVSPLPAVTVTPSMTDICEGGNATLQAGGGGSYLWDNNATTSSITVSPTTTTTYTVTVTNAGGCTATKTGIVNVNASQPATVTPAITDICAGETATLQASNGVSYLWNNNETTASITVNPLATTVYTVTVTGVDGCTSTASGTVNVNQLTNVSVTPSTTDICEGGNATLQASGGLSYLWDNSEATATITVSPTATTTYTVTVIDAGGCTSTASGTVNVSPLPAVTVTPSMTDICEGGNAILQAGGGGNYLWNNNATTSSITVSPTTTTTYTVTVTNADGCTATQTGIVNVNASQPATVTPAITDICAGETATLQSSSGLSYLWNNNETTATITVNPAATTVYTVTVTGADGCTSTASGTVNVNPLPAATVMPSLMDICEGDNAALQAGGGVNYLWDNNETTTAIMVNPLATTTYTVTVTNNYGCMNTAMATVNVNPLPIATVTPKNVNICEGETTTLIAGGGNTYTWDNGETTAGITVSPVAVTSYTVTVTSNDGCIAVETANVNVNTIPSVNISPADTNICAGKTIPLTATGGVSYSWSNGLTGSSITVNPFSTTTYSVTATDANGCTSSVSTDVIVTPSITLNTSITDVTCHAAADGAIDLTVTGGQAPIDFTWSNTAQTQNLSAISAGNYTVTVTDITGCGATISAVVNEPTAINLTESHTDITCNGDNDGTISLTTSGGTTPYSFLWNDGINDQDRVGLTVGTYAVTLFDDNQCEKSIANIDIAEPAPLVLSETVNAISCHGEDDGHIDVSSVSGGSVPYVYLWSDGNNNPVRSGLVPDTYSITVFDNNSCSVSLVTTLVDPAAIVISSSVEDPTCLENGDDGNIILTAGGGVSPLQFQWEHGPMVSSLTGLGPGTYNILVTDANNCTASASFSLAYQFDFSVDASEDVTIETGESTELTYSLFGNPGSYTVLWSPDGSLNCNDCDKPEATPATTTLYYVEVINDDGCAALDSVEVTVVISDDIIAPNVFTPNGDGDNENFEIFGNIDAITSFDAAIYNRWGEKIFQTVNPHFKWDGTYNGRMMPADVYVFQIRFTTTGIPQPKRLKGSVTLIR